MNKMPDTNNFDTEKLDKNIFNTLLQKEEVNFLTQCRRTTEGILEKLVQNKGIKRENNSTYMLGEIMADDNLLAKLGVDINIKSHINFIRLYGNRASHYQQYEIISDEVNYVRSSFRSLTQFFYRSIEKDIPKDIRNLLEKAGRDTEKDNLFEYRTDFNIFTQAQYSIEASEKDYPRQGKKLLSNICSKIIVDYAGHIHARLYKENNREQLDTKKAIDFIKNKKLIKDGIISKISATNEFFSNSSTLLFYNKEVPEVPDEIKKAVKSITDWFFFNRYNKPKDTGVRAIPFFIDLFTLFMGIASIVTAVYGALIQPPNVNTVIYPVFVSTFVVGAFIYAIAFSYDLFYSALPSIRNKTIYKITKTLSSYGNFSTVAFLFFIYVFFLHDLKRDTPYLPFFITTLIWAVSLQVSTYVNNNAKTVHDKFIRLLSLVFLGLIIFMAVYIRNNYNI